MLLWNILLAVGVLGTLGHELNPILYLRHTAINTVTWALTAIAYNTHLGESKYIE